MIRQRTILFCFAGRQANMELQVPLVRRILERHPKVEYHVWNLARSSGDNRYLRGLPNHPRIKVISEFYGDDPAKRFNDVFHVYTDDQFRDCTFIKMDDDVVFLEVARFGQFLAEIEGNRDAVISAKVINNGACTPTEAGLMSGFRALNIPLLDVHLSSVYAEMCHNYCFDNWLDLINQTPSLIPSKDWLSINLIGYDWVMGRRIAAMLGKISPIVIAGRRFPGGIIGDEGAVNCLPRMIYQGFLAAHLYFGPQSKKMGDDLLQDLRKRYAEIGRTYLDSI